MSRRTILSYTAFDLLLGGSILFLVGCANKAEESAPSNVGSATSNQQSTEAKSTISTQQSAKTGEGEHGHIPSAHGGIIVPIGRDSYHAEAIFEKDGAISLYILGADESKINEVESQHLTAYVKASSDTKATPIEFKPTPQNGDSTGKTSRFSGTLPQSLWGIPVEVTIPIIRIGDDRFRFGFSSVSQAHGDDAMPAKVISKEEQDLYLTPGGIYTQADIEANGKVTASQKFAGFMAAHDLKPQIGERICPITLTKANAEVSWTVAGKSYEFCCPPCVDEFVKMAKTDPEKIKAPEDYVKE